MRTQCRLFLFLIIGGWFHTATSFSTPSVAVVRPLIRTQPSRNSPLFQSSAVSIPTSGGGGDDDSSKQQQRQQGGGGTATMQSEILNLVKAIVGAGVLSLPSGIAKMGNAKTTLLPAILLMMVIGSLSGYGFSLIGRVCHLTKSKSYRQAWEQSISSSSSWVPAVSVTLKTLFAILAYSMILGDTFHALAISAGMHINKTTALVSLTTILLLPLCLLKNLSSLAPFSLLGSLGMLYTAVAMTMRYVSKAYQVGGKFYNAESHLAPQFGSIMGSLWNPSTAILLGMLSTAYMAHFNAPKFYTELRNNTIPRFNIVVGTSFAVSVALFTWIASVGFLTFGGASSGLILNNYAVQDSVMAVSRIAVAVSLVFSYPLAFTGARDGVLDLLNIKDRSAKMLNGLTVGILSAVTLAALSIPDVSFVLAFGGATLGNALIYIFPGLMFRGAIRKLASPTKRQLREVRFALLNVVVGAALGTMGAIKAVQSIL